MFGLYNIMAFSLLLLLLFWSAVPLSLCYLRISHARFLLVKIHTQHTHVRHRNLIRHKYRKIVGLYIMANFAVVKFPAYICHNSQADRHYPITHRTENLLIKCMESPYAFQNRLHKKRHKDLMGNITIS